MHGIVTWARSASLWGPVVAYMAVIFVASADSSPPSPPQVSDKLLHLLAYAGLALCVYRALAGSLRGRFAIRPAVLAFIVTVAYGVSDEIHQSFVPGRTPELYDVGADAVGALAALVAIGAWGIIRASDSQPPPSNSAP